MSWLTSFTLQSWQAGAIAAGIVVPSLLVLYFLKLRRKEVPVASTLLWRRAVQDLQVNAPFQKLRRNLLLLLQLLILLLLLLALSRPQINIVPPPGPVSILLIDRSGSMSARDMPNGRTRLDEAKARALLLVNAMTTGSTMMVIAFDDRAEPVQPFTSDPVLLRRAIENIQPTDRRSDIRQAYQLVDAQLQLVPEQSRTLVNADIRLFSDGRMSDSDQAVTLGMPKFEQIGLATSKNIGIVALSAKRNYDRPTQVQVFARLANFGPEPVTVPVQLSVDGEQIGVDSARVDELYLVPERWLDRKPDQPLTPEMESHLAKRRDAVDFRLDLPRGAVVRLEHMKKEGDVLAADDVAQVVVPPPKALSVLLVTDGDGHFITKALRSLPIKAPDLRSPRAYEDEKPLNYDVIVFNNYKPTFLPPAGNFIWFNQVPTGTRTKLAPAGAPGGEPELLRDVFVLDWERDHPIVADLSLSRLYFSQALRLTTPRDVEVLVKGYEQRNASATAQPLIVLERSGRATHVICGFDPLLSDWPLDKPSWPIFLYQTLQYLAVGQQMEVRQTMYPGETVRVPRIALQQTGKEVDRVTLTGPGNVTRDVLVPASGDFVLPAMNQVGLYKTDPAIPGFEQIAVNLLDANESNTLPIAKIGGTVAEPVAGDGQAASRKPYELWWWLALAALGLLMVEWWVYTRRVHL
jgi:hypothetical protein